MTHALLIAHALDAVFGEPNWLWSRKPHPAVLMGKAVAALDRRLNTGSHKRAKGVLAVLILSAGSIGIGVAVAAVPGLWAEVLLTAILIAQRSLAQHVGAVADGLERSLSDGRTAVSMIVGRKTETLSEAEITRAAIESGAENLSDGVIAPALWFLLAGAPGLLLYKVINTADSMIGYRTPAYRDFGWAAARLDDLLNIVPARVTGVLIASVRPFSGTFGTMWRDARKHRSPNAGWPEAAMARALGLALSGPRMYAEGPSDDPYLNAGGRTQGHSGDIRRAVAILWQAWALWMAVLAVLVLL